MKATYIDHMGTDLSVVNAAKVSFGKKSEFIRTVVLDDSHIEGFYTKEELSKGDQGLIQFLARGCTSGDWVSLIEGLRDVCESEVVNDFDHFDGLEDLLNHIRRMPPHWTPFAHTAISIHLKMPIFVARQIMKTSTGMVYNEISRRYVDDDPEFYVPDTWRKRADNVKQGSGETLVTAKGYPSQWCWRKLYGEHLKLYKEMLDKGVAPEQARMALPQSMYTEVIATGNLYSWANMFIQRTDSHAQKETQDLAKQIGEIVEPLFPVSWKALTG